jgi:hypothetical protein
MFIGRIVSSISHVDYVCQIYGPGETERPPEPADYGFGAFVAIQRPEGGLLVGVIYNTTLMNPEYGNLGPRLSPQEDLAVFSPDYLAEKAVVTAIYILGAMETNGAVRQGVPVVAAGIDSQVRRLTREEIVVFHSSASGLKLAYLPMLTAMNNPLAPHLMLQIIEQLERLFPHEAQRLAILGSNLAWKSRVQPIG